MKPFTLPAATPSPPTSTSQPSSSHLQSRAWTSADVDAMVLVVSMLGETHEAWTALGEELGRTAVACAVEWTRCGGREKLKKHISREANRKRKSLAAAAQPWPAHFAQIPPSASQPLLSTAATSAAAPHPVASTSSAIAGPSQAHAAIARATATSAFQPAPVGGGDSPEGQPKAKKARVRLRKSTDAPSASIDATTAPTPTCLSASVPAIEPLTPLAVDPPREIVAFTDETDEESEVGRKKQGAPMAWSGVEERRLLKLVEMHKSPETGNISWAPIEILFPGRTKKNIAAKYLLLRAKIKNGQEVGIDRPALKPSLPLSQSLPILPSMSKPSSPSQLNWTDGQSAVLVKLVTASNPPNWNKIKAHFPERIRPYAMSRWFVIKDDPVLAYRFGVPGTTLGINPPAPVPSPPKVKAKQAPAPPSPLKPKVKTKAPPSPPAPPQSPPEPKAQENDKLKAQTASPAKARPPIAPPLTATQPVAPEPTTQKAWTYQEERHLFRIVSLYLLESVPFEWTEIARALGTRRSEVAVHSRWYRIKSGEIILPPEF